MILYIGYISLTTFFTFFFEDKDFQKQIDDVFTGASRSQEKRDPETPKREEVDVDNMKFESPLTNLLSQDTDIGRVPVISEEEIADLERAWMSYTKL